MGQKVFLQLLEYSAFTGGGKPYFNGFLEWKWWKMPMKTSKWSYMMKYSCSISIYLHLQILRQYCKGKIIFSQQKAHGGLYSDWALALTLQISWVNHLSAIWWCWMLAMQTVRWRLFFFCHILWWAPGLSWHTSAKVMQIMSQKLHYLSQTFSSISNKFPWDHNGLHGRMSETFRLEAEGMLCLSSTQGYAKSF